MYSHSSHRTKQAGTYPIISPLVLLSQKEWEELTKKVPTYRALVNTNSLRARVGTGGRGGCLQPPCVSLISTDRWMVCPPESAVYCILCQLKGMSQHLPPPLLSIHFYCSSTTLLTPFKAEKTFKHNLNSKAHFSISVAEVCSGVRCCLIVAFSSDFLSRPFSRWGHRLNIKLCVHCTESMPGTKWIHSKYLLNEWI